MSLLPEAATQAAAHTDRLFLVLTALSGTIAIALLLTALIFCVRYRAGSRIDRGRAPTDNSKLEWAWIVVPVVAFVCLFVWSARDYARMMRSPPGAAQVYVVAKQWVWTLQHTNGRREIDQLHLPAGQPVRLVMTSQDVIHSFFVPALRIKQDVVPGRYTALSFTPERPGHYRLLCAEYCGTQHASMVGGIVVLPPDAYARWLRNADGSQALRQRGRELFREHGCIGCHDARSSVHAPDLSGVYGRRIFLTNGDSVVADENYLRDSILEPGKQVAAGYAPIMPAFADQLSEADLTALVEFLRESDQTERP